MVVNENKSIPVCKINLCNKHLEKVNHFEYLGSVIISDKKCEEEIRCRLAIAEMKFIKKLNFLTNRNISVKT